MPPTIRIEIRGRDAGLSGNGEAASASRERIATAARPLLKTIVAAARYMHRLRHRRRCSAQNGLPIAPRRAE